jgi:hypothetical protein
MTWVLTDTITYLKAWHTGRVSIKTLASIGSILKIKKKIHNASRAWDVDRDFLNISYLLYNYIDSVQLLSSSTRITQLV